MWKNKNVLVTGSAGLIGRELVKQLKELGVNVFCADLIERHDLTIKKQCKVLCKNNEIVFHLAGIKGSPTMTKQKPVDFMVPMLQFDVNMISEAQKQGIKQFLYTSSIAVENPESDKYPAWAKQTAEILIEAMRIQYPEGCNYCIVRPANVYGIEDLNQEYLMVVSKLIKEAIQTNKIVLDRKGSMQIRDIIHARDCARGMIKAMEEMPNKPVNLCSSRGVLIKQIAEIISEELQIPIEYKDLNLILGPNIKIMSNPYIIPEVDLKEGIKEVIEWQKKQKK